MKIYLWLLQWFIGKLAAFLEPNPERKNVLSRWSAQWGQDLVLLSDRVKNRLAFYQHLLTAGRTGDSEVRLKYLINLGLSALLVGLSYLGWRFLRSYWFPDFQPFGFWDFNGRFWQDIWLIAVPAGTYAVFLGLLDLFGSGDRYEDGTLTAENLPFKWLISAGAGVFEELGHRCLYIYFGLLSVCLLDRFFPYLLFAAIVFGALFLVIFLSGRFPLRWLIPVILPLSVAALWLLVKIPDHFILRFNGWYFDYLKIFTFNSWLLVSSTVFWMIIALWLSVKLTAQAEKTKGYHMGRLEFCLRVAAFTAWTAYAMPLGIKAIAAMPLLPAGTDHLTYCLYIGAILWSNAKFRDGHRYQGPAGLVNSYIFGFYMFNVAFTYGLAYAIAVHFVFDVLLFTAEHLVETVKNRPTCRLRPAYRRSYLR
ncbi:MAG: hypothetical protein MUC28_03315 [Planctomycetes bacterium]|jgi:hypothetical protein|nr:hypothetical protein [Planctomycetota bacterium]